jgi:hypothetical protein
VRHTVDLFLQGWDDLDRFANALQDAQYRTLSFSTHEQVVSIVLLILADEYGKDVVGRMGEFAEANGDGEERIGRGSPEGPR